MMNIPWGERIEEFSNEFWEDVFKVIWPYHMTKLLKWDKEFSTLCLQSEHLNCRRKDIADLTSFSTHLVQVVKYATVVQE